jgi:hypothetical protein
MTSPSTIAERVAQMHATMAADPPAEPIGAFARELLAAPEPGSTFRLQRAIRLRAHDIPAALWDSLAAAGGGHEMNHVRGQA